MRSVSLKIYLKMSAILPVSACRVSGTAGELDMNGSSMTLNNPFRADFVPSGSW